MRFVEGVSAEARPRFMPRSDRGERDRILASDTIFSHCEKSESMASCRSCFKLYERTPANASRNLSIAADASPAR